MNVYDFDNTIYDGETVIDFFFFCLRKKPLLIRYLPLAMKTLARYKLGFISLEELEEKATKYVGKIFSEFDDIHSEVKEFWDINIKKIKGFYLSQKKEDDVIVSASCDFILKEVCKRLEIKNCLCSEIDFENNKITQLCFHTNKPTIFQNNFPNAHINKFYTDSLSDLPMIELADEAYLVKNKKIEKIK